jgi:hypothetical protein
MILIYWQVVLDGCTIVVTQRYGSCKYKIFCLVVLHGLYKYTDSLLHNGMDSSKVSKAGEMKKVGNTWWEAPGRREIRHRRLWSRRQQYLYRQKHRANDPGDGSWSQGNRRDQTSWNGCCTAMWKVVGKTYFSWIVCFQKQRANLRLPQKTKILG